MNENEYVDINAHDNYPDSDQTIDIPTMKVLPLKKICMTIGELPTSYLETMTYYEMLVWFIEYLKNNIIPTVNNNAEAVQEVQGVVLELQNYINAYKDSIDQDVEDLEDYMNNYFENLDVQDEINNKLNQMVLDGTLQTIIGSYVDSYVATTNARLDNMDTQIANTVQYNIFNEYRLNATKLLDIPDIEGYYVQGFTFDGTYYYIGYADTATYRNGIIVKYDTSGEEVARSTETFGHINNIELINNELWIGGLANILIVDPSTLEQTDSITIRDGAAWVVNIAFSVTYGGIPVNQENQYCLNDKNEMIVIHNKQIIDTISLPSTPLTQQGACGYNGIIFNVESVGPDIGLKGVVTMYNPQGQIIAKLNTNLGGELEDVHVRNNTLYLFGSIGENSAPAIFTCNIANLIPWRTYSLIYNAKGQRYKCALEYTNTTQLSKITVPPIVDVYLAYAQPVTFEIDDNHAFNIGKYMSNGGFTITQFEYYNNKVLFITLKYTRSGAQTYTLNATNIYNLTDGTVDTTWNSNWGKVNNLYITLGALTR